MKHLSKQFWFFSKYFLSSLGVTFIICALLMQLMPPYFAQVFLGLNEPSFPFTFQTVMWFPFSMGIVISLARVQKISRNSKDMRSGLFSVEHLNLSNQPELVDYILQLQGFSKKRQRFLPYLFAFGLETTLDSSRFSDVKEEIQNRSDLLFADVESFYTKLKYLAWLLPTMGFMGTVYGISSAVVAFGAVAIDDPNILTIVAEKLSVAFDTTLLALLQSAILVLIFTFQETQENDQVAGSLTYADTEMRQLMRGHREKNSKGLNRTG